MSKIPNSVPDVSKLTPDAQKRLFADLLARMQIAPMPTDEHPVEEDNDEAPEELAKRRASQRKKVAAAGRWLEKNAPSTFKTITGIKKRHDPRYLKHAVRATYVGFDTMEKADPKSLPADLGSEDWTTHDAPRAMLLAAVADNWRRATRLRAHKFPWLPAAVYDEWISTRKASPERIEK